MTSRPPPTVVLLSALETLRGIEPGLKRAGIRLVRITTLTYRPVDPQVWLPRIDGSSPPDAVILTSRAAVFSGFAPWRKTLSKRSAAIEFWAAGPQTARSLRAAGAHQVRQPGTVGARGIFRALRQRAPQNILYFRSDRAGPGLARQLRQQGHRVTDLIVYRIGEAPKLGTRARRELRTAKVLLATSPSALSGLRRSLDRPAFLQLRHNARLVVLGERSRRAAQGHGFRHVSVAPPTNAQGFTRALLRELRNVPT